MWSGRFTPRKVRTGLERRDKETGLPFVCLFLLDIFFIYLSNGVPFPSFPSKNPLSPPLPAPQPTTPVSWPWHPLVLGHRTFTGPRASPPTDDLLGHPLLHMQLEPQVPPCVFFGWWFSPWELLGYWLVHIVVLPMGLCLTNTEGDVHSHPLD